MKLSLGIIILLGTTAATLASVCGILFQCGCTLMEGVTHCNIWHSNSPDCPWCRSRWSALIPFLTINLLTLATAGVYFVKKGGLLGALLVGLIAYLFWAVLVGLASAQYWDYPLFLWWSAT
ncbi:MAG TPA: hypothetical protein VKZ59_01230 [Acidobacteriota bacterium]|nr:hypothetical protein [Acidobacteriota bacterium]